MLEESLLSGLPNLRRLAPGPAACGIGGGRAYKRMIMQTVDECCVEILY